VLKARQLTTGHLVRLATAGTSSRQTIRHEQPLRAYCAKFGPRGVLKCKATDQDDPTVDPRFGKISKQTIEDTGALTKKRMETIDDETSAAAIDYMKRQHTAGKPFFV
jgi:hypothetical protein